MYFRFNRRPGRDQAHQPTGFGHPDKRADDKLNAFVDATKAAKLDIALAADIERELWKKFIFLTALAGSTASLRSSIGPIIVDPKLRGFFRTLMEEAFAVGVAKGVALDTAFRDEQMRFVVNQIEPGRKASMAYDLERGKQLPQVKLANNVAIAFISDWTTRPFIFGANSAR